MSDEFYTTFTMDCPTCGPGTVRFEEGSMLPHPCSYRPPTVEVECGGDVERVHSEQWNVNLFASEHDAVIGAGLYLKHGAGFWVWRTTEGLYDFTARPDSTEPPCVSWLEGAVCVAHGHVPGVGRSSTTLAARCATCVGDGGLA